MNKTKRTTKLIGYRASPEELAKLARVAKEAKTTQSEILRLLVGALDSVEIPKPKVTLRLTNNGDGSIHQDQTVAVAHVGS